MDAHGLDELRSLDWEDIAAKVLAAAIVMAGRYGWDPDSALPGGKSLEGLVLDAVAEIWENPSRRNPDCPLVTQLKGIVRSKLWNLSQSADERVIRSELNDHAGRPAPPDGNIEVKDEFDRAIELLLAHPKVKKHGELELLVIAMSDGATDVPSLARECELSTDRVYQLQRELRLIYPTIARHLANGGRAS